MTKTFEITDITNEGYGIAKLEDRTLQIPNALPGEIVELELPEKLPKRKTFVTHMPTSHKNCSKLRTEAICQYFGVCGGCSLQHLKKSAYKAHKIKHIEDELEHNDLKTKVDSFIETQIGQRRRASLSFYREQSKLNLGFKKKSTRSVVDIEFCPLLAPSINEALGELRQLLTELTQYRIKGHIDITATHNGLDLVIHLPKKFHFKNEQKIIDLCQKLKIHRFARANKELYFLGQQPEILFNKIKLPLPIGSFLQPSTLGEDLMFELIKPHIKEQKILELYAGLGTFTCRMYEQAKHITAIDFASEAILKLKQQSLPKVNTVVQDLENEPVVTNDINNYDLVILDPPRSGASSQCLEIAKSKLSKIVYISCNADSFAKDSKVLSSGGYKISELHGVDQFIYSHHIEIVAIFER